MRSHFSIHIWTDEKVFGQGTDGLSYPSAWLAKLTDP